MNTQSSENKFNPEQEYHLLCPNREFFRAAITLALEKGYKRSPGNSNEIDTIMREWTGPVLCLWGQRKVIDARGTKYVDKTLSFEEFFEFLNTEFRPTYLEVPLNEEYTAKITANTVTVGCQVFSWSKVEEIIETHKKIVNE